LLALAKLRLQNLKNPKQEPLLEEAIAKYEFLLKRNNSGWCRLLPNWLRWTQREKLYRASLEQILAEMSGGIAYGFCKSGDDRKGIEVMHTNAMLDYWGKNGCLPPYAANASGKFMQAGRRLLPADNATSMPTATQLSSHIQITASFRTDFCGLNAAQFIEGANQAIAELNTPGLPALKTLSRNMPSDLRKAIEKDNLKILENSEETSQLRDLTYH
jgi:hypothetical protein